MITGHSGGGGEVTTTGLVFLPHGPTSQISCTYIQTAVIVQHVVRIVHTIDIKKSQVDSQWTVTAIGFTQIWTYSLVQPIRTVDIQFTVYCMYSTFSLRFLKIALFLVQSCFGEKNNLLDEIILQKVINLNLLMKKCYFSYYDSCQELLL